MFFCLRRMTLRLLNVFFFLFFITTLCAQHDINARIDSIEENPDYNQRIRAYQTLIQQQDTLSNAKDVASLYHALGSTYAVLKEYDKVIFFASKAVAIKASYKNDQLETLNASRGLLYRAYYRMRSYEKMEAILLDVINDAGSDEYTHTAYRLIALHYRNKGDNYKAIDFLNLGLANKELCKTRAYELNIRMALITTYSKIYESVFDVDANNLDLSIVKIHQKKIEEAFVNVGTQKKRQLYDVYNNLANIYEAFGDWDNALLLYKKAEAYYITTNNKIEELFIINNIALLYSRIGKHKEANRYYNEIIKTSPDEEQIATAYNNLGYFLPDIAAKDKIAYAQKAVHIILEKEIDNTLFTLPTLEVIQKSGYEQDILIYFIDLANHYVQAYKEEGDQQYVLEAQNTLYAIDQLVSLIRHQSTSEQSKLFWIEKGVNVYMLAVEVSYLLNKPDDAFYFMEKNKALLLQENIKTFQAKLELDIPKNILEREYNLYYKRLSALKKSQDFPDDTQLGNQFTQHHHTYTTFMDSLTKEYPAYAKIKKEIKITPLTEIANENTSFVEFILSEEKGYGLFYSSQEKIIFEIPDVATLQQELKEVKNYITSPILTKEERKTLHEKSFSVFEKLFSFPDAATQLKDEKIIIVPDHNLQTFPFEVLSTRKEGKLSESYLIHHTEVAYLQSFSVFEQIKQAYTYPEAKLLIVAPHTYQDTSLPELTGAKSLIDNASLYEGTTVLFEEKATASNFLKYQGDQEIIHLNTHAGVDARTQTPWIAFQDQKITLEDLYGIKNQAELIILDACKTNTGELALGEGIMSLSRGFFYNGSQSVLASLWNVNEKSSNTLLNSFYDEMRTGGTKSKALQVSKIKYIKEHQFSEALPYYWAAFTLTGSTKPIIMTPETSFSAVTYILLILGVGILVFLCKRYIWNKK